jgi:hypothetical protein
MANFNVDAYNRDRTEIEQQYSLTFTDAAPAAPVAASALTSAGTITSGTLPNTGAWVSGTAKVNPVARQITVFVESVFDATNNVASVVIAISPDNSTFTTVGTPSLAAAVNNTGAVTVLNAVTLPQGWYIKLTLTHAAVAASIYY